MPVTVAVLVLETCHPVDNTIDFLNTYPLASYKRKENIKKKGNYSNPGGGAGYSLIRA